MKEKKRYVVYLDNWMINVGIIGFLNILLTKEEADLLDYNKEDEIILRDGRISISYNKLEFDNDVLADNENFAKRFFKKAFELYGRYTRYIERLQNIKKLVVDYNKTIDEEELERLRKQIINKWNYKGTYSLLAKKYDVHFSEPIKLETELKDKTFNDDIKELIKNVDNLLTVLNHKQYYTEFFENEVQFYLSSYFANAKTGIKRQSGFLNVSVKGPKEDHFYRNVIEPIINNEVKYDKQNRCIISGEQAKQKSNYDSGLVPFLGYPGSDNYSWLKGSKELPLNEIYELIYWCSFAGFTNIGVGNNYRFLFCNQDSSIVELWLANKKLSFEFSNNYSNGISYAHFLTNLIVATEQKATFKLQNTVLIDIPNFNETYPKIHSLYVSRDMALFLSKGKILKKLNSLSMTKFKYNDSQKNIGMIVLEKILHNQLNYDFLQPLIKQALLETHEAFIRNQLQNVNYIILSYFNSFVKGAIVMSQKDNYDIYKHGKDVAAKIKKRNHENKMRGLIHKFLMYLKIGDSNSFMNLFLRIHMAYGMQTPDAIVKSLNNEVNFNAFGYSFINGLLNENNKDENNENESNEDGGDNE